MTRSASPRIAPPRPPAPKLAAAAFAALWSVAASTAEPVAGAAARRAVSPATAGAHAASPAPTSAPATAPARAVGDAATDALRERLARTLGATATPQPVGGGAIRVVGRPSTDAVLPSPAHQAAALDPDRPAPAATPAAAQASAARAPRQPRAANASQPALPRSAQAERGHGRERGTGHGHGAGHARWGYDGPAGPKRWGALAPEFAACARGARQSPIDIRDGVAVDLEPIRFDYRPTAYRVVDNGHTVQVNLPPGNAIDVDGVRHDLVQFHFHRPSEERINGRAFEMVAHLVHRSLEGRLAVVAVLLDRGSAHPLVRSVWADLPLDKGLESASSRTIDLNELLPADRRYYTYVGSLTTPPCTEGVRWLVMQQPVTVSPEQIAAFSRLYPMNARPVQRLAGRLIKQSN